MSASTASESSRPRTLRAAAGGLLFLAALFAASSVGFWLGKQRFGSAAAAAGDLPEAPATLEAPALATLRLPTLDGNLLGPPDYAGQPVVLEFWATWCGPCAVQADILHLLHDEYAPKGIAFLAVNFGEPRDVVRAHVEREPLPYPLLLDEDASASTGAGVTGLPTIVVLGADRDILLLSVGITGASRLRQTLDAALAS